MAEMGFQKKGHPHHPNIESYQVMTHGYPTTIKMTSTSVDTIIDNSRLPIFPHEKHCFLLSPASSKGFIILHIENGQSKLRSFLDST